jgi:hypothetical protein
MRSGFSADRTRSSLKTRRSPGFFVSIHTRRNGIVLKTGARLDGNPIACAQQVGYEKENA